jgi:predicted negative regulator of RcsB-dependent stress response
VPAIQHWFTGGAVAAFLALLGAVSTLGYAWYRAAVTEMESASSKAASAAQKLKADRVKGLLAKALVSGDKLIRSNKDTNEDQEDAEKWGQQTHDLIAAAYGEGRPRCS